MKRSLLLFAASALIVGTANAADIVVPTPDFAAPPVTPTVVGTSSLWLGAALISTEDDNFDSDVAFNFGGDSQVLWQRPDGHDIMFDIMGRAGFPYDDSDGDNELAYFSATLHGIQRNGQDKAYGIYASLYGGGQVDENDSTYYAGLAAEHALFLQDGTLYGQLGGGHVLNSDAEGAAAHVFGRLGWRHFLSETSFVDFDGLVGYMWGTDRADESDGIYGNIGVKYEHQYAGTPLSGFIAYRGYFMNEDDPGDDDESLFEHVLKVGATLTWGGTPRMVDHYAPFDAADHSNLLFKNDL